MYELHLQNKWGKPPEVNAHAENDAADQHEEQKGRGKADIYACAAERVGYLLDQMLSRNYDSRTFAMTKGKGARNDDAQTKGPGAGADEKTSAERDISVT